MQERRKIEQVQILDKKNNLEYTIIPNYKVHKPFLSQNEIKFYRLLIKIKMKLKDDYGLDFSVFTQVALNRIVDINNARHESVFNNLRNKSIDFVLYDNNKDEIYCCIELNDETHNQAERFERDIIVSKILKGNVRIIFQKRQDHYDMDEIIHKILECKISSWEEKKLV